MPLLGLGNLSNGVLGARRPTHHEKNEVYDLLKEARQSSKPSECILCGKRMGRPRKSHSVPKFVIKNIASSGHVFTASTAPQSQILDDRIEVKQRWGKQEGAYLNDNFHAEPDANIAASSRL